MGNLHLMDGVAMPDFRARTDKQIFISYSRANRTFALELRQKLTSLGFKLWRDIEDMPIGEKWWQAIQEAIQACESLVLCVSPESLASPNVTDEWHYARELGKRVMPVVATDVDFSKVPRWMSRIDWADFRPGAKDADLVWARFINQLNAPHEPRKVPFMAEPPPPDFVQRLKETEPLVKALVDETHSGGALSVALQGAGGFGKTTLARAIAHDRRVRASFDDGTLWVTLGEKVDERRLIGLMLDLCVKLTGSRPPVTTLLAAGDELRKAVGDSYLLFIADDVWQSAHLDPFLNLGKNAATLITTRNGGVLPTETLKWSVDAMKTDEALKLLRYKLPAGEDAAVQALIKRLGEWPLLLKLANGALRKRIDRGEPLKAALKWVDAALNRKSFDGLANPDNKDERHRAASATLGASLELLDGDQYTKYERLAIFPEDVDVPLATLEKLWNCDYFDVEELCQCYANLSLLLDYNLSKRTIRLHDVVRTYLRDAQKTNLPGWNATFLDSYQLPDWSTLPANELYLWHGLAYHLHEAGRTADLRSLLLDGRFLYAKLCASDFTTLMADFEVSPFADESLRLARSALNLSAHVLSREGEKSQLSSQLRGRLFARRDKPDIQHLVDSIPDAEFRPLNATHIQAGGALLRILDGHTNGVTGALVLTGSRLLSWSYDGTLRLWATDGTPLGVLEGHTREVRGALELTDGRLLSWSLDRTLRLWAADGTPIRILEGHKSAVGGGLMLDNGDFLSWSDYDDTLRLWAPDGTLLRTLEGHKAGVFEALILSDGRILSRSGDKTLRLWTIDGTSLLSLEGHTGAVDGVLVLADGRFLSWSRDKTLRLWAMDGTSLRTLMGHTYEVRGVFELTNGQFVSWSKDDGRLWLWAADGAPLRTLEGHTGAVDGALVLTNGQFLSWGSGTFGTDGTLRLWAEDGTVLHTLEGHRSAVRGALELTDGRILSWSSDNTLRLWAADGIPLATFEGHQSAVRGALELVDGYILSWSLDRTLRLWTADGALLGSPTSHTGAVRGILELADGRVLSWSSDPTLRLWTKTGMPLATLKGHTAAVEGVLELTDGRILSWSGDSTLRLWATDGTFLHAFEGHTATVEGALELTDGRILSWSGDSTLRLWATDGTFLHAFEGHTATVEGALELTDGRLLSWSVDGTLRLWAADGVLLRTLEGYQWTGNGALELTDERILSWSAHRTMRLWAADGAPLRSFEGHTAAVGGVLELTDGRFLSWSNDTTLRLWAADGTLLRTLEGHSGWVTRAFELTDGRFLSWSNDTTLRLWAADGTLLRTLEGHSGAVTGALELANARFLSWAGGHESTDSTLRLWAADGTLCATFYGDMPISCCVSSRDVQVVIAGDVQGRVMFLRVPN